MKLDDAIKDYLRHILYERGLSKLTFKHYQARLHGLQRWMGENGFPDATLDALTTPTLRRYLYALSSRGLRPRTVRGVFNAVRGLCEFLVEMGGLETNPATSIKLPKMDAAKRLTVSDEEIAGLLGACERQPKPRQIALSRAVLSVLIYAGLRRAETCDLKVDDFDPKECSLLVRNGKGSKSRRVYLPTECVTALREWLAVRETDCKHDFLFSLDRNRRMHNNGIATLIETVKAIAGYAGRENIKPHSLRHACATRLLRNGADLRSIQAFLGHTSIVVTAQYLHTDEEQLRSIADLSSLQTKRTAKAEPSVDRLRRTRSQR
jgi:site-specific recombinase XerD